MAKTIDAWLETDVAPFRDKPIPWLSEAHFFRDPSRPTYSDLRYFFSPADGILLYQRFVRPDECILDIKGRTYSVRDALRDPAYDRESLVLGIFMTFYDVHVNRVPYPGRLSYRELDPLDTHNHPMLEAETTILEDLFVQTEALGYLHHNQRFVNRVDSVQLGGSYFMVQIADYDVDCITPFNTRQNQPVDQGQRFSQIRYGSQVELVVPLSPHYRLSTTQSAGAHVEAGVDPLIQIEVPSA